MHMCKNTDVHVRMHMRVGADTDTDTDTHSNTYAMLFDANRHRDSRRPACKHELNEAFARTRARARARTQLRACTHLCHARAHLLSEVFACNQMCISVHGAPRGEHLCTCMQTRVHPHA
eukprot:15448858-Alexandrium_andersonii.AAC.1